MARQRKDLERTTAIMSNIKNPWTPPGQETTPEQKKQISTQHSEGVKHGLDKGSFKKDYKTSIENEDYKTYQKNRPTKAEQERANYLKQFNAGYGGIETVAAPHEYVLGGGPVKGVFSLAKTAIGLIKETAKRQVPKMLAGAGRDIAVNQVESSILKK